MNNSQVFAVDKKNRVLICDASDLTDFDNGQFQVQSAKTGKVLTFKKTHRYVDQEGECYLWVFKSDELPGWTVSVFND